jgi:dGTP triphosphohydrolase
MKTYSKLLINRVSDQYEISAPTLYGKSMAVLDYISGMTDIFALDLYRKSEWYKPSAYLNKVFCRFDLSFS